jgi:hypothetical protein
VGKQTTFRLTWVALSIVSAFMLGLFFQPGSSSKRRIPPNLNMQQMQRRMPSRAYRAPQRPPQQPRSQSRPTPNQLR